MLLLTAGMAPGSALAGAAAAVQSLPAGCSQIGTTVSCTYLAMDAEQVFAVPAKTSSVTITAIGAAGAPGVPVFVTPTNNTGGEAAQVTGMVAVQPGATLYVEVGGVPTYSQGLGCTTGADCVAGWNGGGGGVESGGGGGGASDVRTVPRASGTTLGSRLIVAGGGGGGSGDSGVCTGGSRPAGGSGGNAGLLGSGAAGAGGDECLVNPVGGISTGGGGGTQSGSGSQAEIFPTGGSESLGVVGALGVGGTGLTGSPGGGGGGFWGGSSGSPSALAAGDQTWSGSGGGGGSSKVPAGGSAVLTTAPASVTISYTTGNPFADVAVSIRGPRSEVAGARFTEIITVVNNGPDAAFGLTTVADIPRQLTVLRSAPAGRAGRAGHASTAGYTTSAGRARRAGRTLTWIVPMLPVGGKVRFAVTFDAASLAAARVSLRAAVTTVSYDPTLRNNTASIAIKLRAGTRR